MVNGAISPNQIITFNGYVLLLKQFKNNDEKLGCGVRIKAWQLHYTLHPTITLHSPLVFDVYDAHLVGQFAAVNIMYTILVVVIMIRFPLMKMQYKAEDYCDFKKMEHSIGEQINVKEYNPDDDFLYTLHMRRTYDPKKNSK